MSREFSDAATVLILGYLSLFCTDVIHINPLIVGTILAISKVIDAVTDVIAGYVVDRTDTKWGKGRPYTFCQFGVWICIILLFSCPQGLPDAGKIAWVCVMYILAKAVFSTLLDASERVYQLRAFNEQQIIRFTACSGIAMSVCGFAALSILALPVLFILPALMRRFTIRQILVAGNLIAMVAGVVGFLFYKNIPILIVVYIVSTIGTLPGTYIGALIILQCAEYNEYCGKRRMEGRSVRLSGLPRTSGPPLERSSWGSA